MNEMEEIRQRTADRRTKIACELIRTYSTIEGAQPASDEFIRVVVDVSRQIERGLDS